MIGLLVTGFYLILESENKGTNGTLEAESEESVDILNESVPKVQKLTVQEIADLPFNIIQFVRDSEDPLKRLQKVLNDFPKHGHIIGNYKKRLS
jgi:hypothetical protein